MTNDSPGPRPDGPVGPLVLHKLYTEHLGQLTGTLQNPLAPLGIAGTDLGVSFARDGQLVLLFGDSWTIDKAFWDQDSAASAPLALPSGMPALSFLSSGSRFLPLLVPGVKLDAMNVPVEGIALGKLTYVFFSAGWSEATGRHSHSVLAHCDGLSFGAFALDHATPSERLINISAVEHDGYLWLFGSGHYRKSPVYLARVAPAQLADRASWEYYRGQKDGAPELGPDEATAAPIVPASCVGELSVRRHPKLPLYLMAYNCDAPRGITLRTAPSPTGPWSDGEVIFDPGADQGYEHFMHAKLGAVGHDDGLSEAGRDETWGGEYGPYLVPEWFEDGPGAGVHAIVYTLSSWNPYQVHLMRTVLGETGATAAPPVKGAGLPPARLVNGDFSSGNLSGWTGSGDGFGVFQDALGRFALTTFVPPRGDALVGQLWQDFTVDARTTELEFWVHGGDAAVKLVRLATGDVVRTSRGQRKNDVETHVRWQLAAYRGEKLRLLIDDSLTGAWGFVGARGFVLK